MSIDNAPQTVDHLISLISDLAVPFAAAFAAGMSALIAKHTLDFQKESHEETASAEQKRFKLTSEAEEKRTRLTVENEKEKMRLAGLAEAFRLLNDEKHREARRVLYNMDNHNHSGTSYNIIGIPQFDINHYSNHLALESICKEIVKNDCNEIGVLGYHGYLDEEKFVEEGFWVILKVWDLLKDEIMDRREKDSEHHMQHLERLRIKACEYAKMEDHKVYSKFCCDMDSIANDSTNGAPTNPNTKTSRIT